MNLGIFNFAAITILAYMVGLVWKTVLPFNDKWIPIVCGLFGAVVGFAAYFIKVPDFPAQDVITAVAIGVASGLAATGINQIGKQLSADHKDSTSTNTEEDVEDSEDEK